MKKILLFVFVIVCVLLVLLTLKNKKTEAPIIENLGASNTQPNKEEGVPTILGSISSDQVGIFKIGASVPNQNLLSKAGYSVKETTYQSEGYSIKLYVVSKDDRQILTFELLNSETVYDITVNSSQFTTDKNITVGSTISDFINAYPNYRLWYTAEEGEKFILNTEKDASSPQFFLDRKDLINPKGVFFKTGIKVSDFKADAEIIKIRVY